MDSLAGDLLKNFDSYLPFDRIRSVNLVGDFIIHFNSCSH